MLSLAIGQPAQTQVRWTAAKIMTSGSVERSAAPMLDSVTEAAAEQRLVKAVLAGNANAFQQLVETHQTRVFNLALRMLGNEREAEDAAQDAFVQAYTRLASYNSEWRFKTWLMTITSNLCIDKLRRRKLEPTSFTDYNSFAAQSSGRDEADMDVEFVSNEPQPETVATTNEQRRAIQALLQHLSDEDRSMVIMFYWDDLSYEDIARTMHTTVSAVKSRLFRARRALAQSPLAKKLGLDALAEAKSSLNSSNSSSAKLSGVH